MSIFGDTVTLINRTPRHLNIVLRVQYDGRRQDILPGENPGFPKVAVIYAKRQNPVMGTEDPENPTMTGTEYLVAVRGGGDPSDEFPEMTEKQWYAHLGKPQKLNRDLLDKIPKTHEELRGRKIASHEARAHVGKFEADA